jgi:hypothetical protein
MNCSKCHHRRKKRPFSAEKLRPKVEKDTTIPLAAMDAEQEMI